MPYVYADGKYNPQDAPPSGLSMQEWATESTGPVGLYTPHAAPMQLVFYTGDQFPEEYRGDAFIAMRGSWNRRPPSGYHWITLRLKGTRSNAAGVGARISVTLDTEQGPRTIHTTVSTGEASGHPACNKKWAPGSATSARFIRAPTNSKDMQAKAFEWFDRWL